MFAHEISKQSLEEEPLIFDDGIWTYEITLADRLNDTIPTENKMIRIIVTCNDKTITVVPVNQPDIRLPNMDDEMIETCYTGMFLNCTELTDISSLHSWDMTTVDNINCMFAGCVELQDFSPISNWDVRNITDFQYTFMACERLFDLRAFKRWNMNEPFNATGMFANCINLIKLNGIEQWNMDKCYDMTSMFENCIDLRNINALCGWNITNVESMRYMFSMCSITDVSALSSWDMSHVLDTEFMFANNIHLKSVMSLSNWRFHADCDKFCMFCNCNYLYNDHTLYSIIDNAEDIALGGSVDDIAREKRNAELNYDYKATNVLNDVVDHCEGAHLNVLLKMNGAYREEY